MLLFSSMSIGHQYRMNFNSRHSLKPFSGKNFVLDGAAWPWLILKGF